MQQQGRYGRFDCLNCGRSQPKDKPNQKFCRKIAGANCHDRFWNKGNRKISQLTKRLEDLEGLIDSFNPEFAIERIRHLEHQVFGGSEDE